MKTKRTLLLAGVVSAIVLSAPLAGAITFRPLIVLNPTGSVRIQQALPCGDDLDTTRRIAGGRIDVTPVVIPGDVRLPTTLLHLTRMELFLTPFSVRRACQGIEATVEFFEMGYRLVSAVSFPAEDAGAGQLRFRIPKEKFLIYASVLDNAPFPQPERMYQKPSEDVTGLIDLRARTVEIHVALSSRLLFRAGCVRNRCVIDEVLNGTQTAEVRGTIHVPGTDADADGVPDLSDNCPLVPNPTQSRVATPVITPPPDVTLSSCQDHTIGTAQARDVCHDREVVISNNAPATFAVGKNLVTWSGNDGIDPIVTAQQTVTIDRVDRTPPTVSCTAVNPPPGRGFQVSAADDCGGRLTLALGSFALGDGEVIQIQETGRPGVRLIGTIGGGIRHFQVGKGEGVIRGTDAAGNVARALCR